MTLSREELLALVVIADGDAAELDVKYGELIGARKSGEAQWTNIGTFLRAYCFYIPTPAGEWRSECGELPAKVDKSGRCKCGKEYILVKP